ncbi:conserved hypothetical protein [Vibrio aestuarianus]|nr:conserved hypothetical protein [Vibrio aestuarianus]
MNAKFAQRNQRVVLEIGAAVVVAWLIIIFSIDLFITSCGLLLNLKAIVEWKYFINMTEILILIILILISAVACVLMMFY